MWQIHVKSYYAEYKCRVNDDGELVSELIEGDGDDNWTATAKHIYIYGLNGIDKETLEPVAFHAWGDKGLPAQLDKYRVVTSNGTWSADWKIIAIDYTSSGDFPIPPHDFYCDVI